MNTLIPQMASVSDLQRDYKSLLDTVDKSKRPVVLLKDNQARAALIGINELEELILIKDLYEKDQIKRSIASFDKAKNRGKLISANSVSELFTMIENENKNIAVPKKISQISGKNVSSKSKKDSRTFGNFHQQSI